MFTHAKAPSIINIEKACGVIVAMRQQFADSQTAYSHIRGSLIIAVGQFDILIQYYKRSDSTLPL
jgi:hypothetical protein